MGPQPGSWLYSLRSKSGKIMHTGPDSVLAKEGATRATAMNPVEFFQIGIH